MSRNVCVPHKGVGHASLSNYWEQMKTTRRLFARGKVTVPSTIREEYDLDDGDLVELEVRPVEDD